MRCNGWVGWFVELDLFEDSNLEGVAWINTSGCQAMYSTILVQDTLLSKKSKDVPANFPAWQPHYKNANDYMYLKLTCIRSG